MGPAFPISFRSHSTRSSCLHLNRGGWSCYAKKRMHPKDNTDLLEMKTSLILWHHYFRLPFVVGPKHCFSNRLLNPGDKEYCQPACTPKWKGFDPRYLSWFSFEYQRGFLSLSVLCDISLCQSMSLLYAYIPVQLVLLPAWPHSFCPEVMGCVYLFTVAYNELLPLSLCYPNICITMLWRRGGEDDCTGQEGALIPRCGRSMNEGIVPRNSCWPVKTLEFKELPLCLACAHWGGPPGIVASLVHYLILL